jgi:hypothetical protein
MRQRKGISYPQMGAFVQPRPGSHHMPTAPHALRMTHQRSRVKVSGDSWRGSPEEYDLKAVATTTGH